MNNELHERLGHIIDLLDEFLDEPELSDEFFHTIRPTIDVLNDVYDEFDEHDESDEF